MKVNPLLKGDIYIRSPSNGYGYKYKGGRYMIVLLGWLGVKISIVA